MNETVGKKQLREFGLLVGTVFGVIGTWPLVVNGEPVRLLAIGLGGALIFLGSLFPLVLAPLYKAWMWIGHILGWINTKILLAIVFYGLITPMGILFRLSGKKIMTQAFALESPTYRVSRKPRPRGHMKYQF